MTVKPLDDRAEFRINSQVWTDFKILCGGREASEVLRDYVEECVKKNIDLSGQID